MRLWQLSLIVAGASLMSGCGTTRWTDTKRTATEQMLVSDAVDRTISRIDFAVLAGKEAYLDTTPMGDTVDKGYVVSTLRQHMLACGVILKEKREDAAFVVEVRAGAVGTDRNDLLYGVPAMHVPLTGVVTAVPATLPEIAFARRTNQQGVAKLAVFAYHRESGKPVWQSGNEQVASKAQDLWVCGAGPFRHGTIYDRTQFAGDDLHVPLAKKPTEPAEEKDVRVARGQTFIKPDLLAKLPSKPADIRLALHTDDAVKPGLPPNILPDGPLWQPLAKPDGALPTVSPTAKLP